MFVLVLGDNLVVSWYRSRILGHVVCGYNQCCFLDVALYHSIHGPSFLARRPFITRRCFVNPEVVLNPEVMWESGVSPLDPEIVSGPEGLVGTRRTRRSFENPEVLSDPEVVFRTLRSNKDPESKSVSSSGSTFALYVICSMPESKRVSSSGIDARVGAGGSLNRNLEVAGVAHSQQASPGQGITPVIFLSQVLLRSGTCSNLEENKFPRDRPGSSRRFQVDRPKKIQDPGLACRWMARLVGLAGEDHLYLLKYAVGDLVPRSEAGILSLEFALQ
ncbi:hypothetical protein F2Q68_00035470 [Brassica cretica]|uniref:Uncharacterized protein n=1 Tax=Brassica cretica TaxID=69181 RepID=A0A8S9GXM1_BRACR|nr:hypothetical protein F2Q68_00035470 [Brassica cretica]